MSNSEPEAETHIKASGREQCGWVYSTPLCSYQHPYAPTNSPLPLPTPLCPYAPVPTPMPHETTGYEPSWMHTLSNSEPEAETQMEASDLEQCGWLYPQEHPHTPTDSLPLGPSHVRVIHKSTH